tara:strand:+ start:911 stop:1117 length:207 start_codon:yes stop_codon:yes gene_type:complete
MSKYKQTELFSKKEMKELVEDEVAKQSCSTDEATKSINDRALEIIDYNLDTIEDAIEDKLLDLSEQFR